MPLHFSNFIQKDFNFIKFYNYDKYIKNNELRFLFFYFYNYEEI